MKRFALCVGALVACGYDRPADRCDGDCALYGVDQTIVRPGDKITLEGTFEKNSQVQFPGSTLPQVPLAAYGPHRAIVEVPNNVSAGTLSVLSEFGGWSNPIEVRVPTFHPSLQAFTDVYEQTDVGRFLGAQSGFARVRGSVAAVGNRLFLIGGATSLGVPQDSVDTILVNSDDTIGEPMESTVKMTTARANHASFAIGNTIYVIGGTTDAGAVSTIEATTWDPDTSTLTPFQTDPSIDLRVPREGLALALVGNYVYAVGGKNGSGDVAGLERAPIYGTGALGAFEEVAGVKLTYPRSGATVAVVGSALYVIGGVTAAGAPVGKTERFDLFPDSFISDTSADAGDLNTPRGFHTSIVIGDSLYVMGGFDGNKALSSIERATIGPQLSWETDTIRVRQPRRDAMLALAGNHVYQLGGRAATTGAALDTFERASIIGHASTANGLIDLDPFLPSATMLDTPRSWATTVTVGNTLYVIGGADASGPVATIEAATIQPDGSLSPFSTSLSTLTTARMGAAAFVYQNFIYVAGGKSTATFFLDTVERAPIQADGTLGPFELYTAFKLESARAFLRSAMLGRTAYFIGGATASGSVKTVGSWMPGSAYQAASPLVVARSELSMLVLGFYAYAECGLGSGSLDPDGEVAMFTNPGGITVAWMTESNQPSDRHGGSLLVLGDDVFALGGAAGSAVMTERASIAPGDSTSAFTVTPSGQGLDDMLGHTALTIGDRVVVIGGASATTGEPRRQLFEARIR